MAHMCAGIQEPIIQQTSSQVNSGTVRFAGEEKIPSVQGGSSVDHSQTPQSPGAGTKNNLQPDIRGSSAPDTQRQGRQLDEADPFESPLTSPKLSRLREQFIGNKEKMMSGLEALNASFDINSRKIRKMGKVVSARWNEVKDKLPFDNGLLREPMELDSSRPCKVVVS